MPIRRPADRRPVRTVVLSVGLVLALMLPAAAQDLDAREDAARRDLAETEARIDEVSAQLSDLRTRLEDARARLRMVEGQLALAEREHEAAAARTEAAEERLAQALQRLAEVEAQLEIEQRTFDGQAASAYKYGSANQGQMFLRVIREAESPNDVAVGLYKLRSIVDFQRGIVERVATLRQAQAEASTEADRRRDDARREERIAADALALVTELHVEAASVADAIAADEADQEAILASLESDREVQEQVLAQVEEEQRRREEERRAAAASRQAAGGGPCPVDGARVYRDFTNDWGHPRPGGRRHEGTDIFADRGTPIRAMFQGTIKEVRRADNRLGGRIVSYWVADGEHWYHAHLETVADLQVGDPVEPGTLIGTVGNSGNARGTPPHLHIGNYVDDVARNPFPVLEEACP